MNPAGEVRWVMSQSAFRRLADGQERLIGALSDMTERHRYDEEREVVMRQQETLLHELNHRVKNNLQMITSILRLQATRSGHDGITEVMKGAIERVQAIADLHSHFTFEKGKGQINVREHLETIVAKLRGSVLPEEIRLEACLDDCVLPIDQALPLGLIINELLTNVIKYAFPDGRAGNVLLELKCTDDGVRLMLADDGVGIAEASTPSGSGLGTKLIEGLCSQIDAELNRVDQDKGTKFQLTMPRR